MKPLKLQSRMNKTEERYAHQLELMKKSGLIIDWGFEKLRFRLANGAWFKPDFLIVYSDRFEIHEIKGSHFREAGKVRLKIAAELFPWFRWKVVRYENKVWNFEDF